MSLFAVFALGGLNPPAFLVSVAIGVSLAIFEILFPQPTESTT